MISRSYWRGISRILTKRVGEAKVKELTPTAHHHTAPGVGGITKT
jgi:hypothetical protein